MAVLPGSGSLTLAPGTPDALVDASQSGSAAASLSLPTLAAASTGGAGLLAAKTPPFYMLPGRARAGHRGAAELPLPTVSARSGSRGAATITLSLSASGQGGQLGSLALSLQMLTASGQTGARGTCSLPRSTIAATGLPGRVATAAPVLPLLSLQALLVSAGLGVASVKLPRLSAAASAKTGTRSALARSLGPPTATASGFAGGVGLASGVFWLPTLEARLLSAGSGDFAASLAPLLSGTSGDGTSGNSASNASPRFDDLILRYRRPA